jgi:hypothetical protein
MECSKFFGTEMLKRQTYRNRHHPHFIEFDLDASLDAFDHRMLVGEFNDERLVKGDVFRCRPIQLDMEGSCLLFYGVTNGFDANFTSDIEGVEEENLTS